MKPIAQVLKEIFVKKVTPRSLSSESSLAVEDPKDQIAKEVRQSLTQTGLISADQARAICFLWFGVVVDTPNWKLKECTRYGQYFEIRQIHVHWALDSNEVMDLKFVMYDGASDTSMSINISVKDLNTWMSPLKITPIHPRE
jgi:hypothetical protein